MLTVGLPGAGAATMEVSPMVLLQVALVALEQTAMLMAVAVVMVPGGAEQVLVAQVPQAGTRAIPQSDGGACGSSTAVDTSGNAGNGGNGAAAAMEIPQSDGAQAGATETQYR